MALSRLSYTYDEETDSEAVILHTRDLIHQFITMDNITASKAKQFRDKYDIGVDEFTMCLAGRASVLEKHASAVDFIILGYFLAAVCATPIVLWAMTASGPHIIQRKLTQKNKHAVHLAMVITLGDGILYCPLEPKKPEDGITICPLEPKRPQPPLPPLPDSENVFYFVLDTNQAIAAGMEDKLYLQPPDQSRTGSSRAADAVPAPDRSFLYRCLHQEINDDGSNVAVSPCTLRPLRAGAPSATPHLRLTIAIPGATVRTGLDRVGA